MAIQNKGNILEKTRDRLSFQVMMRIFRLEVLSGSKILAKLPNGRGIKQFFQENLARYGKVVYFCNGLINHPEPNSGSSPKAQDIERLFCLSFLL